MNQTLQNSESDTSESEYLLSQYKFTRKFAVLRCTVGKKKGGKKKKRTNILPYFNVMFCPDMVTGDWMSYIWEPTRVLADRLHNVENVDLLPAADFQLLFYPHFT